MTSAQRVFEQATKAGVRFITRNDQVIAVPSERITPKLRAGLERNREAIRAAVLAASVVLEYAAQTNQERNV